MRVACGHPGRRGLSLGRRNARAGAASVVKKKPGQAGLFLPEQECFSNAVASDAGSVTDAHTCVEETRMQRRRRPSRLFEGRIVYRREFRGVDLLPVMKAAAHDDCGGNDDESYDGAHD